MDNATFYNALSRPCPVAPGSRIRLVQMHNDPDPVPTGSVGTVVGGNGAQVYVDWDSGRSLMLIPGVDRWEVVQHG
jgi:Domain of unknown function (DUF4314)